MGDHFVFQHPHRTDCWCHAILVRPGMAYGLRIHWRRISTDAKMAGLFTHRIVQFIVEIEK